MGTGLGTVHNRPVPCVSSSVSTKVDIASTLQGTYN